MSLYDCGDAVALMESAPVSTEGRIIGKPTMEQMERLQNHLAGFPQIDLEPKHYFADGMYGRELFIPAESVVVGKIHRHEHIVMLISGDVTINTDKGMQRIQGPKTWISQPGEKRALVTHTDCLFFTMHLNASNSKDLDVIEAEVIVPEANPLLERQDVDYLQAVYA